METLTKISNALINCINFIYIAVLLIIGLTTYWVLSGIHGFLYPKPTTTEYVNSALINREMDDTLITSRAFIDAYLILEKKGGKYKLRSDLDLNYVRNNAAGFKDNESTARKEFYQLCAYSIEVKFGYDSWQKEVDKAANGRLEDSWPRIIGIEPIQRSAAPSKPNVESACFNGFTGTINTLNTDGPIIRSWLKKDKVYDTHIMQGINQVADIALWEKSLHCESNQTCGKIKENISTWKQHQLVVSDPYEQQGSQTDDDGRQGTKPSESLGGLAFVPVRGLYKETYSSLIFLEAKGRYGLLPLLVDMEIVVQRKVLEVTYGSAIYFNDTEDRFGQTIVYASVPDVVMRSLIDSEYVLFADGKMEELVKAAGMPVSEYLQNKTKESLDSALQNNRKTAIRTSKAILRQKLGSLKSVFTKEGISVTRPVKIKFTHVPPDTVGFSDNGLMHYLEKFLKN